MQLCTTAVGVDRFVLTLYIDESGDHNLQNINPDYPCFVLGGVLVDEDYHDNVITPEMNSLKKAFFNTSNVNLHLYDVKRQRGAFGRLSVESTRKRFWAEWRKLMRRWDYTVIACVIDKPAHVAKYASDAADPYDYALKVLVERLTMHLNDCDDTGRIVAKPDVVISTHACLGSTIGSRIKERAQVPTHPSYMCNPMKFRRASRDLI